MSRITSNPITHLFACPVSHGGASPRPCAAGRGILGSCRARRQGALARLRHCLFAAILLTTVVGASAGPDKAPAPAGTNAAPTTAILVPNGNFELPDPADPRKPFFWDLPDGLGVKWVEAAPGDTNSATRGKTIRMDTAVSEAAMVAQWRKMGIDKWDIPKPANSEVAATYGLSYYSDTIPVEPDQAYRVSFRFQGASGGAKVWVRGYGTLNQETRRLYETIVNCRCKAGWTEFSQAFHPTKNTPKVTQMRVMLYAYWPPGVYWFDDVKIEPITAAQYETESKTPEP